MIQLQENTVIADRFRLVRMIGRGGMGSVWEAVHIGLDTPCALKFIEGELMNVGDAHARFEREAKVSAQLRSPNIVQIIDHGVWQGRPYIAMELLEGKDLAKMLADSGGRLAPATLNMVIQQVCRALTKAHGAGVVHRDLKPENIFIVKDDDREVVKILDFGVAKSSGQAIEGSNTKTGAMLGTPYYMSPEQAQGIKTVDARSDLWAIAVIAYQCLTGKLPFESEALGDLLVKIIVQPIPVPSSVASVPPGFDRWWTKAAQRDPDYRFQTAKELALELEQALEVTSSYLGPPSSPVLFSTQQVMTPALPPTNHPTRGAASQIKATMESQRFNQPVTSATFSGVEPPAGLPKKGVPIALFAVFGVLALVGIAGASIAYKRGGSSNGAHPVPTSSAVTVATTTAEIPPPPPPSDTTTAGVAPTTSAASAETSAKPVPTHVPTTGGTITPPPTTTATTHPAPPASAKKKWDPGF